MSQYMEELEQDPFDVEEFIERLTWRTNNEMQMESLEEIGNPDFLQETFIQTIKDLKILQERQQRKCDKLEEQVKDELKILSKNIGSLQDRHQVKSHLASVSGCLSTITTFLGCRGVLPTTGRENQFRCWQGDSPGRAARERQHAPQSDGRGSAAAVVHVGVSAARTDR
jgi:hypothetical protein